MSKRLYTVEQVVTPTLETIDRGLARPVTQARRFKDHSKCGVQCYWSAAARRLRYRDLYDVSSVDEGRLRELRTRGFTRIPEVFDPAELQPILDTLNHALATGEHLEKTPDFTTRYPGDRRYCTDWVPDQDLAKGEDHFRSLTRRGGLADPMVHLPQIAELALDERILRYADAFLRSVAVLSSVTLRKTYVNDLPRFDTFLFHYDPNSVRYVKAFIYLQDVELETGPMLYVQGSESDKFRGWRKEQRYHDHEIESYYSQEGRITPILARAGDVVLADTTGFHRGSANIGEDRALITLGYSTHPEFFGQFPRNAVAASALEGLTPRQRAATDLLDPVTV